MRRIAIPRISARSRTISKMAARAPTSTPTVGESRTSTRGVVASHFASTTRCWLPPESVVTGSLGHSDPDGEVADPIADRPRTCVRGVDEPAEAPEPPEHRDRRRCRQSTVAGRARGSGGPPRRMRFPSRSRRGWSRRASGAPSRRISPASGRVMPKRVKREARSVRRRGGRSFRGISPRWSAHDTSSYSPWRESPRISSTASSPLRSRACTVVSRAWPVMSSARRWWLICPASKTPTRRLSRSTVIRSAISMSSTSRWLTKTTAMPASESRRTT